MCGVVVLVLGLGWQALHRDYLNMLLDPLLNLPVLLAILGTALATLSLLGLLGAAWRNTNIMYSYLGVGVLILTLEVVFGLVFYRYMDQVLPCPGPRVLVTMAGVQVFAYVEAKLVAGMAVFSHPGYRGVTETWNVMQHEVGRT